MSIAVRLFEELAVAGLAFSLLSALPASASGQSYTLVDLTAATEESHGMARDVNSERVVVGVSGFFCAARWDRIGGEWVHQELIPDFCSGPFTAPLAFAINNSSTVVGSLFQQNSWFFPLIVDQGQYETFPQLAGIFWDINNAAQAVGSNNPGGSGFIWEDGKLTSLGVCPSNEKHLHQRVLSCSKTRYLMSNVPSKGRPSNENRITRTGS